MPVEITWIIPLRVIYERFYGDVTIEDIRQVEEAMPGLMAEGVPLIHTLIDVSAAESSPNLREIQRSTSMRAYDGEGWRIIIGVDGLGRFMGSVIFQLMGQRYRMFDTLEQAAAFLSDQDETITLPAQPRPEA